MVSTKLISLLLALRCVLADVEFIFPQAGSTITGTTIPLTWKESGNSPPISELASYQVFLCAGGNSATDYIPITTLVSTGNFATGNNASTTFNPGYGAPTTNAYFVRMISAATGGAVINYSDRFTLASMDGAFPSVVINGLKTVNRTAGPPTENDIQAPQSGGSNTVSASSSTSTRTGTSTTPSTSRIASTLTKSSTSPTTSTSNATSSGASHGTTLTAGAGAAIAVGAILLLVACVSAIYCISSRRRAASKAWAVSSLPSFAGGKAQLEDTSRFALARREKVGVASVHELPANQTDRVDVPGVVTVRHELQGDT